MAEWRPVVGYEGWYEVSDLGQVRRVMGHRGNTYVGKVLCPVLNQAGYATVVLYLGAKVTRKRKRVHILVATAFIEKPTATEVLEVNHINGNRIDNRACNLEWVTQLENKRHALHVLGRKFGAVGTRHSNAKLNDDIVRIARIRAEAGVSIAALAKEHGVAQPVMWKAVNGRTWKHVTG